MIWCGGQHYCVDRGGFIDVALRDWAERLLRIQKVYSAEFLFGIEIQPQGLGNYYRREGFVVGTLHTPRKQGDPSLQLSYLRGFGP